MARRAGCSPRFRKSSLDAGVVTNFPKAGLFSVLVSILVVQSLKNLPVNFAEISAHLAFEMVNLQRASMKGLSEDTVPVSSINPTTPISVARSVTWVNALWFTSLASSLATALIAVLCKEWINQFLALPSGTPRDRARIRQLRYDNLKTWHVHNIVALLPVLMHTSLGAFFAGILLYVYSLNKITSLVVGAFGLLAFIIYLSGNLLPVLRPALMSI